MKKKVALIYNVAKKENLELCKKLNTYLENKKIKTIVCKTGIKNSEWKKLRSSLAFAIVLGGDGTLLSTSRQLAQKGIPICGINTGHLGFLTEGKDSKATKLVEKLLNKKFKIDERTMLQTYIVSSGNKQGPLFALNDVVISRGTSRKMINMTLNVDGRPVADYIADGLIISTPTGSTAYALSAGGAIMEPGIGGFEIVPICAHTLTSRPHIVSDKREITITFNRPHKGTILQIDGQETFYLQGSVAVKISRSGYNAKLIRLHGIESDFYWRIRQKFHFGQTIQ